MLRLFYFLLFLFLVSVDVSSQDVCKLYYNNNWELCDSGDYEFYRIGDIDPGRLKWNGEVRDYYKNDSLCMIGNYVSGSRNGEFRFYYSNGQLERKGNYVSNRREGEWVYYYENGVLKQRVVFIPVSPEESINYNFSVLEYYSIKGKAYVIDGTGRWKYVYTQKYKNTDAFGNTSNTITITGHFKDGKKNKIWKKTNSGNPYLNEEEWFNEGVYRPTTNGSYIRKEEMMSKFPDEKAWQLRSAEDFIMDETVYDADLLYADSDSILTVLTGKKFTLKYREAGYTEGDNAFYQFIGQNLRYPRQARDNGIQGTVYVQLTIDEHGKPKDLHIAHSIDKELDKEAIRVISLIKEWTPALRNGRPVESKISLPVTFVAY